MIFPPTVPKPAFCASCTTFAIPKSSSFTTTPSARTRGPPSTKTSRCAIPILCAPSWMKSASRAAWQT
ncbi:MAG: hypothetical protein KIT84_35935 [Labilithrix sp.]|nr:hypothetical protein [Labilithrix sp.]MCW5816444.1 hypothetical protein [Labilithrix sp.]